MPMSLYRVNTGKQLLIQKRKTFGMPYCVIVCILLVQEHGNPSIALEDSLIDDHEI